MLSFFENNKSKIWILVYSAFFIICTYIFFFTSDNAPKTFCKYLQIIIDLRILEFIVVIAFGGDILRKIYFQEIKIVSGYIPLLRIILEAVTYVVIIKSSLLFLNALSRQRWIKDKIYFDAVYFDNFDFLTLAFASIFLIVFTGMDIKDIIMRCLTLQKFEQSTPISKAEYLEQTKKETIFNHIETDEAEYTKPKNDEGNSNTHGDQNT